MNDDIPFLAAFASAPFGYDDVRNGLVVMSSWLDKGNGINAGVFDTMVPDDVEYYYYRDGRKHLQEFSIELTAIKACA